MLRTQLIAVSFIAFTVALGCRKSEPDYFGTTKPLHPPDEVWINNSSEPEWIDPGLCSDVNGGEIIRNMFAGLVDLHPETLEPMPDIAERYELSEDGTRYTFHLRESAWSDGTPFTAHDFEWSWKRVLDKKTASKYSMMLYPLKNADVFNQQAFHLKGVADKTDDEVKALVEAVIPVSKVKRDGDNVFVFVTEPTDKKKNVTLTRQQAVDRLQLSHAGTELDVQIADHTVVGVRAESDYKLVVDLEIPVGYFLNLIGFYTFMPVPRHLLEDLESRGLNTDLWTRPEHLVCNGAYKMTEWRFRQHMVFEPNDNYWNADAPHLFRAKKIRALMIESYNTALNMYCTGEIDWMGASALVPSEFIDDIKSYKDYDNSPYLASYFYWFNVKAPPVDNPLVRKALSLAIDREKITKYILRAGQIPSASLVPNGVAGYKAIDQPIFDPDAARAALAEAGYPNGEGFPPLTLIYNTTEVHKQVATAAQQMWKEHLDIDVTIENQEWKVYLGRLTKVDFQMARLGWTADYADANNFLELFASTNGNNHSNWGDAKFDQMLLDANSMVDKDARLKKLQEAEAYAFEQQPMLPLYSYTKPTMVKPYLGGFFGNELGRHSWKYLFIKEEWYDGVPDQPEPNVAPPVTPIPRVSG